jgi:hypothetical protein
LLVSLFFLTAAFVESIYVLYLHQSNKTQLLVQKGLTKIKKKQGESNGTLKRIQQQDMTLPQDVPENSTMHQFNIQIIDFYALLASGFSFLIFNICYWATFLAFIENLFADK